MTSGMSRGCSSGILPSAGGDGSAALSHGSVPGGQLWKEKRSVKANKERYSKLVWQQGELGPGLPCEQELVLPGGFFFVILKNRIV